MHNFLDTVSIIYHNVHNREDDMRAIIYVRCSTEHQTAENGGVSIENQMERCCEYADRNDWDVVDTIRDEGISGGKNRSRKGFVELLDRVDAAGIDIVLVYSLERLSRDMLTLLALEKLLDEGEIQLHTVDGSVDTSTVDGFLAFAMKALLGEIERRQVKDRTRKAMKHKKSHGQVVGSIPFGYRREGNELVHELTEQRVIRTANELYQDGTRLKDIVAHLNDSGYQTRKGKAWVPAQVSKMIQNYRGSFTKSKSRISEATRAFIEVIA